MKLNKAFRHTKTVQQTSTSNDMKTKANFESSRREALKMLGITSSAGLLGLFGTTESRAAHHATPDYAKGLPTVKIKSVKAIATRPKGQTSS